MENERQKGSAPDIDSLRQSTENTQTDFAQKCSRGEFLVYYRAWRDREMHLVNTTLPNKNWMTMEDIPYGVTIVNIFSYVPQGQGELARPYFDKLKHVYGPALHQRGVKLVRGIDYSKLLALTAQDAGHPTETEYDCYAQKLIAELMTPWGLDGLDIDMEADPSDFQANQIQIMNGMVRALAKYIGPCSAMANSTLFLYDTNGSYIDPLKEVADCFNLLPYQQYGSNSDRTQKVIQDYEGVMPASKFMPGLAFPEEGDKNRWYDATRPYQESNIYSVAKYVRDHQLGGMFLYAPDRDGRTYEKEGTNPDWQTIKPSNLLWTKTAIIEANGWQLNDAKNVARHYLARITPGKAESKTELATITRQVERAENLLEVNEAILGRDFGLGVSDTYDPMLEKQLLSIDLELALNTLEQAKPFKENNPHGEVTKAWQELAALIGAKAYSQIDVTQKTDELVSVMAALKP